MAKVQSLGQEICWVRYEWIAQVNEFTIVNGSEGATYLRCGGKDLEGVLGRVSWLLDKGMGSHPILGTVSNVGQGRHQAIPIIHCTIYVISVYWILEELYLILLLNVRSPRHTVGIYEDTVLKFNWGSQYVEWIHRRSSTGIGVSIIQVIRFIYLSLRLCQSTVQFNLLYWSSWL